jgi:hypothetical protein
MTTAPTVLEHASRQTPGQADPEQGDEQRHLEFPEKLHPASFHQGPRKIGKLLPDPRRSAVFSRLL